MNYIGSLYKYIESGVYVLSGEYITQSVSISGGYVFMSPSFSPEIK
jgi:hypothetical protein